MSMTAARPAAPLAAWLPWTDRAGRLSWLKLAAFLFALAPLVVLAMRWQAGELAPKPLTAAIHFTGRWTVRLLVATLAVTPLRVVTRWNRLVSIRRTLGLAALFYGALHLTLYVFDQRLDLIRVASEIALRFYLTIGFVALVAMAMLGATSNDAAVRRLGAARWNGLHRLIYPIAILGLFHYFLQTKNDVTPAVMWSGYALLLLFHRLVTARRLGDDPYALVGLAIVAALATALVEAAWYYGRSRLPPLDILAQNFDFEIEIRPPWFALAAGLSLAALAAAVRRFSPRPARGRASPRRDRASAAS